ncbi:MAG: hypothetical protein AAB489_00830 [Patescibacteria group bacterium]
MQILSYLFYPNPGNAGYGSPKAILLLGICATFVVLSLLVRFWRGRLGNPVTKRLSNSWSTALLSFGVTGIVLTVARVEGIQFVAMRFLWALWAAALALYLVYQIRNFRHRHYTVLPMVTVDDPRGKYLPAKKQHS